MKINSAISLSKTGLSTTLSERVLWLCARAKDLEEAGEFEDARATLQEFWQRIGQRPLLNGLDSIARAELLLRAGALSGWLGSARQIPGAQEIGKDLITESAGIFEELALPERVCEARIDLAICYWREGAHDEARVTLQDVIARLGETESEQRLRALLNLALVEKVSTRYKDALNIHSQAAPLFGRSSNHALRGKFHNSFASALKNLGLAERRDDYIDRALIEYTAATFHFEQAGHNRFLAVVENNLGFLFVHLEKFEEAHRHLDRARAILTNFKDRGLVAQVEDTRARAFLGQGRIDDAEAVARSAVKILREGDEQSVLAAALTTQATALARNGRRSDALAMLNEAVNVAGRAGDPESGGIAALTIIEELASTLPPIELRDYYQSAESALKQSQHAAIKFRLGQCARSVLSAENQYGKIAGNESRTAGWASKENGGVGPTLRTQEPAPNRDVAYASLEAQVLNYEGDLIKQALEAADGSVTRAARMLGITHQGLAFIINGRHKNLLASRKPVKRRRRSIIRNH